MTKPLHSSLTALVGAAAAFFGGCPDYFQGTCFDLGETSELTLEVVAPLVPDAGMYGTAQRPSCERDDVRVGDTFTLQVTKRRRTGCAGLSCDGDPYLKQGTGHVPDAVPYVPNGQEDDPLERLECGPPAGAVNVAPGCDAARTLLVSFRSPPPGVDVGEIAIGSEDFSLFRTFSSTRVLTCPREQQLFPDEAYGDFDAWFSCTDQFQLRVVAVEH